jgi:chorismate dehydratase
MRVGRIPYINCYPVYGGIDRGVVPIAASLVDGVPTALNDAMASGRLDISVVSAVEYARAADRYLLLPDLAVSCDGPVRSVMLFSKRPAPMLGGCDVLVSRSSLTSVELLHLLFDEVWHAAPRFTAGDAELSDVDRFSNEEHEARLVIGDAALLLGAKGSAYPYAYDLGEMWKMWTGLPFVFAVWIARRDVPVADALGVHASLIASRDWGLGHLPELAGQAADVSGVSQDTCLEYLSGLDYRLSFHHLSGLTAFYSRLVGRGRVPDGTIAFLPAA